MLKKKYALLSVLAICVCSFVSFAQPVVSLTASEDAQISSATPTTGYGGLASVKASVVSSTDYYRGLFKFSFTGIPSSAVIVSAQMVITASGTESGTTNTSLVAMGTTSNWSEGSVTYATQPSVTTTNQQGNSTLSGSQRSFDIKAMVQAHISGSTPITGIMVKRVSETTVATPCIYFSKETGTTTNRPVLNISWYDPVRVTTAAITKTSGVGTSDGGVVATVAGGTYSGGSIVPTYAWYNTSGSMGITTTGISGKPAGCYGIVITPAYGPVYSTMFLVGTKCELVTMDLIKDPQFVDDAGTYRNLSSTNFGTSKELNSGNISILSSGATQFFLKYRLWYDTQYDIFSATQTLYGRAHSTEANSANLYRTTANWDEATINYTNRPSYDNTTPAGVLSAATTTTTDNRVLNVTDFFNYWEANPAQAYGYTLVSTVPSGTKGFQNFYSSDTSTVAKRPLVTVSVDDPSCIDKQSYVPFKRNLDGTYINTYQKKLKLYFTEEYQIQPNMKVPLTLLDENNAIVAAIDINGSAISGKPLLPAFPYAFDDNRFILDLTSYGLTAGKFYVIELTRSNGEKSYIKFQYSN